MLNSNLSIQNAIACVLNYLKEMFSSHSSVRSKGSVKLLDIV